MEEYTPEQKLLQRIKDERCGGVAAELARRIGKDVTYVNRLFYPIGKKGRKGIGLEVMRACSQAFDLPAGFWEGADSVAKEPQSEYVVTRTPDKGNLFHELTDAEWEFLNDFRQIPDPDRVRFAKEIAERASVMREFLARHMERAGLPAPRSAGAGARRAATTAVQTAQRSLDLDKHK